MGPPAPRSTSRPARSGPGRRRSAAGPGTHLHQEQSFTSKRRRSLSIVFLKDSGPAAGRLAEARAGPGSQWVRKGPETGPHRELPVGAGPGAAMQAGPACPGSGRTPGSGHLAPHHPPPPPPAPKPPPTLPLPGRSGSGRPPAFSLFLSPLYRSSKVITTFKIQ